MTTSSTEYSTSSPKSPLMKKNRLNTEAIQSSQSDVSWKYYENSGSPNVRDLKVGGKTKQKSANQLSHTPVRIVRRNISSPNFMNAKQDAKNLPVERKVNQISKLESDQNLESSFDLSSDEFKIDFDDEQLLQAIKAIDEADKKKRKEESKYSRAKLEPNFEDSFDDALINSIPLDEMSKQSSSNNKVQSVDIVFDPKHGLSQVLQKSPVQQKKAEKTLEPFKRFSSTTQHKLPKTNENQNRNKSKESNGNQFIKFINFVLLKLKSCFYLVLERKLPTNTTSLPVVCTPSEIAEKRRIALERLKIFSDRCYYPNQSSFCRLVLDDL